MDMLVRRVGDEACEGWIRSRMTISKDKLHRNFFREPAFRFTGSPISPRHVLFNSPQHRLQLDLGRAGDKIRRDRQFQRTR